MGAAIARHLKRHSIAYLALFVALGGTSYAAIKLPKNSVGSRQLKANSVTSRKVRNHSLLARDFRRGQLPRGGSGSRGSRGPRGPRGLRGLRGFRGATGATGAAGTARAYALVSPSCSGSCPLTKAKGVAAVQRTATGTYCVDVSGISAGNQTAVVSVDSSQTGAPVGTATAMIQGNSTCPTASGGQGFVVRTDRESVSGSSLTSAPADDVGFAIVVP